MDAVSDPAIREVWAMKSAQVGWTEILNNVIGFHIDQDPSPILIVQPTVDTAEDWSRDRLAPMIRDTPCLTGRIADAKSRDSGNTLRHKKFPGGLLAIAGANSPSGLASKPIRITLFDEVDKYPASAGAEGDPIALGRKRSTTFWNRKMLAGSTPSIKGSSRIESGFESSDKRFYFVPCLHCGGMQRLVWEQVKWGEVGLAPELAAYQCVHCGELLTNTDKPEMLRRGEWRSTKPSTGIAGFHISELYSPWVTWGEMATAFLEAKKLPETLQTWINSSLGETWEDQGEKIEAKGLLTRVESYTAQSIPPGVLLITAGTDVQDDRLETFIYGWGQDEEAWRLDHIVLRGDPGGDALWKEHDAILRRRFRTDDGRELPIEATCIDSGGHFTEAVYRYCTPRKRYRVWAIKGIGGPGRPVWQRRPSRAGKSRSDLWPIGVDTVKDLLYGRLKRVTEPGPGYFHFDAGCDEAFFDQLTSEVLVYRVVQGRRVRLWRPKTQGARQEGLDGTVYAYAALIGRGGGDLLASRAKTAAAPPSDDPEGGSAPPSNMEQAFSTPEPPKKPKQLRRPRRPMGWMRRRF